MAVTLKTEEEQIYNAPPTAVSAVLAASTVAETVTIVASPSAVASSRRYDQATIERALAMAAAMQEEHQATLTAEQVVRLGEEMNVDPAFVLKALSRLNAEEQATTSTVQEMEKRAAPHRIAAGFRRLPFTDRCAAVILPTVFSLLTNLIFREMLPGDESTFNNWYAPLLLFIVAPLFVVFLGIRLRSKRLGFLSGGLSGLLTTIAVWLAISDHSADNDFILFLIWTLLWSVAGAVLGGLTSAIALHGARMYRRSVAALARYFPGLAETDAGT